VRALGPDQAGDEGVELIAPVEPLSISSAIDSPGLLLLRHTGLESSRR
jgi:hypothetical protein